MTAATQQPAPASLGEPIAGSVREDYGIQKVGFWLAVGTLVAIVSIILVLLLTLPKPVPIPTLTTVTSAEQVQLLERWAKLQADSSKAAVDRTVQIGQLFVTGALLPVMTALLGYIFGKRNNEEESEG